MAKDKQRDYSFAHCYWKTNYFADFMANFGENQKGEDFLHRSSDSTKAKAPLKNDSDQVPTFRIKTHVKQFTFV